MLSTWQRKPHFGQADRRKDERAPCAERRSSIFSPLIKELACMCAFST